MESSWSRIAENLLREVWLLECLLLLLGGNSRGNVWRGGREVWLVGGGGMNDHIVGVPGSGIDVLVRWVDWILGLVRRKTVMVGF